MDDESCIFRSVGTLWGLVTPKNEIKKWINATPLNYKSRIQLVSQKSVFLASEGPIYNRCAELYLNVRTYVLPWLLLNWIIYVEVPINLVLLIMGPLYLLLAWTYSYYLHHTPSWINLNKLILFITNHFLSRFSNRPGGGPILLKTKKDWLEGHDQMN